MAGTLTQQGKTLYCLNDGVLTQFGCGTGGCDTEAGQEFVANCKADGGIVSTTLNTFKSKKIKKSSFDGDDENSYEEKEVTIKPAATKDKKNIPIAGAILGGSTLFFISKKVMKVKNIYALIGLTAVGILIGGITQNKIQKK